MTVLAMIVQSADNTQSILSKKKTRAWQAHDIIRIQSLNCGWLEIEIIELMIAIVC